MTQAKRSKLSTTLRPEEVLARLEGESSLQMDMKLQIQLSTDKFSMRVRRMGILSLMAPVLQGSIESAADEAGSTIHLRVGPQPLFQGFFALLVCTALWQGKAALALIDKGVLDFPYTLAVVALMFSCLVIMIFAKSANQSDVTKLETYVSSVLNARQAG